MSRHTLAKFCLAFLAIAVLTPATAAAAESGGRSGWTFGLNYGAGTFDMKGDPLNRDLGTVMHVRAGYFVTPDVAMGLEGRNWSAADSGLTRALRIVTASAAFYPTARNIFLTCGLGVASTTQQVVFADPVAGTRTTVSHEQSGFAAAVGVGSEMKVYRRIGLGLGVEYSHVGFNGGGPNPFLSFTGAVTYRW